MTRMNRRRRDGEQLIGVLIPAVLPRPKPPPAPLPRLPARRDPAERRLLVDAARVDPSGRVWATTVLRALGWTAGHRISIDHSDHALVVRTAAAGHHTVGTRGSLGLPAPQRQMSSIDIATTVILVAAVDADLLLVCPVAVVGPLFAEMYARLLGVRHDR
jgi:hypothetical protein